jgi:hypothetical protein
VRTDLLLILAFVVSGCAVTTVSPSAKTPVPAPQATEAHTFAAEATIKKLMLGVSREEALALIGRNAIVGYELKGSEYKPVTMPNPYRSQKITKGADVFVVDYYVTGIDKADGAVTNDEVTPLIFEADKLVGKGWDYLNQRIKRQ